jgi:hypothetical protein
MRIADAAVEAAVFAANSVKSQATRLPLQNSAVPFGFTKSDASRRYENLVATAL